MPAFPTFQTRLEDAGFRPAGFDYLRLGLAVAVVAWHSDLMAVGTAAHALAWTGPLGGIARLILPMFFALSGFLVAGSLERSRNLVTFLGLRFLRIYPALTVEVVLSALLIGPAVTALPLRDYFGDGAFWRYLANVSGDISYALPGVFAHNPVPGVVNGQLWTVPWELVCYIAIGLLSLMGIRRRRHLIWVAMLVPALALGALFLIVHRQDLGHLSFTAPHDAVGGPVLVLAFLAGIGGYLFRERIVFSPLTAAACLAGSIALLQWLPGGGWLAATPVAYATVVLGLCRPPRGIITRLADYSYGVFLYGFPIQQLVAYVTLVNHWTPHSYLNLAVALPLSLLAGMASWHLVEKPALRLKPYLQALEARLTPPKAAEPAAS